MPVSKSLQRLLRLRAMEEGQRSAALESVLGELHALQRSRDRAVQSARRGRVQVAASVTAGNSVDRQAALVEIECAQRRARQLEAPIAASELKAADRRQELLDKRVEKRQVGTLIEKAETRETIESDRRSQQAVDDWYGARLHGPDDTAES